MQYWKTVLETVFFLNYKQNKIYEFKRCYKPK